MNAIPNQNKHHGQTVPLFLINSRPVDQIKHNEILKKIMKSTMSSIRELRVVLNHHQEYQKIASVIPNEVMVYRRHPHSSLDPNKHSKSSKESKNSLKIKKEPETSTITIPRRLTRSSLKTPPPPVPENHQPKTGSANKKRGRPKKSTGMTIKREYCLEIKQEPISNNEITQNNSIKRDYPLRKRLKQNPVPMIDLTGPETIEIKQENQYDNSSTLDPSEMITDSSTSEKINLNDAFIDETASINDSTIDASINNENDQNMNNKHMNYSINSEELDFVNGDIEDQIKVHVITVSDTDEFEKTKSSPSKSSQDQKMTEDIEPLPSKSSKTQGNHQIEDLEEPKDPPETKMKCLTEIISEVFDSKLPDSEERIYFTLQHLLDEYKQEEKRKEFKRVTERKKYEKTVLSNVRGIKLLLNKMNKKILMIDQMTQTDESLDEPVDPSGKSTEDPIDHPGAKKDLKETPEAREDQNLDKNPVETIPEDDQHPPDLPADDLAGMIVLDSLDTPNDHQGSVFQRLGHKSPVKSTKHVEELLESPDNPSPGPLKMIELQREMIERRNRERNIVIEGFRCSKSRVEADVSEYIWKKMGINPGVVKVIKIGKALVVTVASHFIKKQILKRRGIIQRSSVHIADDYTGREKKVQQWLGDEVRRRQRAGENVRAAYGKIYIGGIWWFWNELEGKLTRNCFRPELVSME